MKDIFKEFIQAIIKEWIKARTIFTFMFYGAFIYLMLKQIPIPPELNTIISTLFGYWYGQKKKNNTDIGEKNGKPNGENSNKNTP